MVRNVYNTSPAIVNSAVSNFENRHKALVAHVTHLFSKKKPMLSLWQEIAENFYPERADFTIRRSLSDDFASNISTSYPILVRRDLGNQLSSMLRPPGEAWFHQTTSRQDRLDLAGRQWLEAKTKVQMRAMTDPISQFSRATSEADHDFASFGQAVLSVEVNRRASALLYRTWHLRDVVWCEKFDGSIGLRARKWKPCARDLKLLFKNVHPNIIQAVTNNNGADAYREIDILHIVVPAEEYDGPQQRMPYISMYIDVENKFVMEETGIATGYYVIPRWQTVSGYQYAHSPAVVAALPDARLLQAITFTLLKAGEKAVDPPMIGMGEVIKSPIDIQPGGVTYIDADYDERTGEALRILPIDSHGIPVGLNMQDRIQSTIASAFFLDKMQLPQSTIEMTAYEVSQRLQQYIRQALPLFGPIENEYNAPLCEDSFTLLMANNAFGPLSEIPESLAGADVRFRFESPLIEASDQQLVQTFQDTANLLGMAAQLDPGTVDTVDAIVALRETLQGRQVPSTWIREPEVAAKMAAQKQQQQQLAQQAQVAQQLGDAGQAIGNAKQSFMPQGNNQ